MNVSPVKTVISKDSYKGAALFAKKQESVRQEMLMPMHFCGGSALFYRRKRGRIPGKDGAEAKVVMGCDLEWTGRQSGLVSGKVRERTSWNWKEMPEEERCSADTGKKQYFTR